jgi:hypothetical protein
MSIRLPFSEHKHLNLFAGGCYRHRRLLPYDKLGAMNILVAFEQSGRVREACIARGHNAISCDILPTALPGPHLQGGVLRWLRMPWDMIIAFPPCKYLTRAGAGRHWNDHRREQAAAAELVKLVWDSAALVAIENPIGCLNQLWRYPTQTVQPWWFGDPWTKATCLWLKGLPPLLPTRRVAPEYSWVRKHSPDSHQRSIRRSLTPPGLALAMAVQWLDNRRQDDELGTQHRGESIHSGNGCG